MEPLRGVKGGPAGREQSCLHPGCPDTHASDKKILPDDVPPKSASEHTIKANRQFRRTLPFGDRTDFDNANKGLLLQDEKVTIRGKHEEIVWDLEEYKKFISPKKRAPDTVNASLWRNAQLCMINGLFEVTEGIYQVRGYDLSNITFVKGRTGWIVFDPLISAECSKAALDLMNRYMTDVLEEPARKVVAVIYSHSHIDHFGGAHGIISEEDALSGDVKVLASEGFTEHAVSENVIAGNVMGRRAVYMYGSLLPRNQYGGVNSGLGQTTSTGSTGLIVPNDTITHTDEERIYDGVRMIFQFTPGTEAPTEMNTYFPHKKALWMAENTTCTMHNILTLRGAVVRDALKWASYLTETIEKWGQCSDVKFQSHHWPLWGSESIFDYLKKQRDMYKFIHDQSVRWMNKGYIGSEISEMLKLPEELHRNWSSRGYYGTLSHNSRAVYQRYMGWYSGNPCDLNNLPPEDAAKKYVEYMNGEAAVLLRAKNDFDSGEYRWVVEALKHVVFANPESAHGKSLLADALEQLGYQAESGAWRSEYLQGAYELRNGVPTHGGTETASPDIIKNMDPGMLFDFLGVHIMQDKAEGEQFTMQIIFTDLGGDGNNSYLLSMENSVLSYVQKLVSDADVNLILKKEVLNQILLGDMTLEEAMDQKRIHISGDDTILPTFLGLIDTFDFWFNIVTP